MSAIFFLIAAVVAVTVEGEANCKRDVLILADGSSTICDSSPSTTCPNWLKVLEFIKGIVSSLTIGPDDSKVALITFGDEATVSWNLDEYKDKASVLDAIGNVPFPGGELDSVASFSIALSVFSTLAGDRSDVQNIAIMIMDNANVTAEAAVKLSAELQKAASATLFVVCVTGRCPEQFAKELSSYPHERGNTYFLAKKYILLDTVEEGLKSRLCDDFDFDD